MRKLFLLFTAILLGVVITNAQTDTAYIMKSGSVINKYNTTTQIDSIIFYSPTQGSVSVQSVAISPSTAAVTVGGATAQLSAVFTPANATNKGVTWAVTVGADKASVNSSGVVTGLAAGTATITVTTADGGKTATCTVTVTAAPVITCLNTNGDFSSGMTGWSKWTSTGCCGAKATADAAVVGGELVVNNIVGTASPAGQFSPTQLSDWDVSVLTSYNFQAGKTYSITFDARSTSVRALTIAIRKCTGTDCNATYYAHRQVILGASMTKYTIEFTYTGLTGDNSQIMFLCGESSNPVYLDNVCISEGSQVTPNGKTLKIMPVGNSITQGSQHGTGTYRKMLYYELKALGYTVDMVGIMETMANSTPFDGTKDPKDPAWDQNHEAYWGNTTSQVLGYLKTNLSKISAPDIVTLHLGTNNLSSPSPFQDLKDIITEVRKYNPNVTVFIAQLIDAGVDGFPASIDTFNSQIPALAAEMNTGSSPVIVVNQHVALDATSTSDFVSDKLHPTFGGAAKMAKIWVDAITAKF